MSREPLISVCVTTRNRAHLLPRLLDALERQALDPGSFEVVIVNDGSTDETQAVLDKLAADTTLALTVLHEESSHGPAAGRNLAWRTARAPIVAFTDDDCEPTPWWLAEGVRVLSTPGQIGTGRVMPHPEQMHRTGPFSYTIWVEEDQLLWFATANLFVRREDLEAVGGFDENLWQHADYPTSEDTDLGLRIVERGATPVFLRRALVYHDIRAVPFRQLLAEQARWSDIPGLIRRHPWMRGRALTARVFWKPSHPRLLLLFAGLTLGLRDRRALALAAPWLHYRTCVAPLCEGPRRRWFVLPGAAALEASEIGQMIRGSVRHRTLVL